MIDSDYVCTWTGGDGSGEDGGEDNGSSSGGGGSGGNGGYIGNGFVSSSGDCSEGAVAISSAIQTVLTSQHMDYPLQSVSNNLDILRGYATTKENECAFTVSSGDGEFFALINNKLIV